MRIISAIISALLLAACGGETQPDVVVSSQQSACKPGSGASFVTGSIDASIQGDTITVRHEDAYYNCASKLKLDATVVDAEILVQETITNPGELALCMCNYDLEAQVKGLAAGSYSIKVLDVDGKLVGSAAAQVGGARVFQVGQTLQSDCKPESDASFVGTKIKVGVQGNSATIRHQDAEYNCAAKLKLSATLSGSEILVQETVTNPEEAADCMCNFDLELTVGGLASGSYTVKLVTDSGAVVDSVPIVVD